MNIHVKIKRSPNKSLDASGGSVFLNLLGAAKGALIRAAASTQPLSGAQRVGGQRAAAAHQVASLNREVAARRLTIASCSQLV